MKLSGLNYILPKINKWKLISKKRVRMLLISINLLQHGIANTNPTCYQFISALKTCVVNNLGNSIHVSSNCENDSDKLSRRKLVNKIYLLHFF
jgi:hypothetical protein